ncbi:hypothetical protein VTN49DRAFT_4639 [Thermomyces lanuginosus]|uniref:uncharacterized protein n=1 Tax=Thermomyces lanuginosus TaxID=5541 RepID=UPI003743FA59
MESLVYENSPLAHYLEGEGERAEDWTPQQDDSSAESSSPANFAPKGASTIPSRIRDKLPTPLEVHRFAGLGGVIKTICSSTIGRSDNEKFLEQFGYVIVASQLLDEHRASTLAAKDGLPNLASGESATFSSTVGLTGAVVTAATSFFLVWVIHWSRPRAGSLSPWRVLVLVIVLPIVGIGFYAFARRQWLKFLRHQAVQAANAFIGNAKGFDSVVSASVLFIQEVELVSRGYRISTPLPPISRLEESAQVRRCLRLRRTVSECLYTLLEKYVQAQRGIRALADSANLDKYYDIYEVTPGIIRDAEETLAERDADDQYSLRSLRALFARTHGIRKSILCCLLALKADGTGADIATWSAAVEEMCNLATVTGNQMMRIRNILDEQDRDVAPPPLQSPANPGRETLRAQLQRLNSLTQGIRALHAKMYLMREESDASMDQDGSEKDIGAALMAQYESIGADIRGLLEEWEAGKTALLQAIEQSSSSNRSSLTSSELRSPLSPASSFGGTTAVDGSPSAALRALNGETPPAHLTIHFDSATVDPVEEEIFEAVASPSSRKRSSLSREERIARMKEERAKQAAARERAETSTHMLRELETVIKHRPQLNKPARITSI